MAETARQNFIIQDIAIEGSEPLVIRTYGPFAEYALALDYALRLSVANFLIHTLIPPKYESDAQPHIHPDQTTIDDYITNPDSGC